MAWLTGWNRRKSKIVNGSTAGIQTNYQMQLIVHKGSGTDTVTDIYLGTNVRNDFGDVRFTRSDGSTLLNYWIDPSTLISGTSATFWIQIDSIPISPGTTTIYIYYDNPLQTTTSNPITTFNFFEDFSTNPVSSWTFTATYGAPSYSVNGIMSIGGVGNRNGYYTYNTSVPVADNSEWNIKMNLAGWDASVGYMYWNFRYDFTANNGYQLVMSNPSYDPLSLKLIRYDSGAVTILAQEALAVDITHYYAIRIAFDGLRIKIYLDGALHFDVPDDGKTYSGTMRMGEARANANWDDIRVRKLVSPEPTFGTTGVEELSSGSLSISSIPSGARIFIDNVDQGVVTSSIITNISPGSHSVKLTLANYNDYITTVSIISGQTTVITPTPTLTLLPGSTRIEVSPSFTRPSYIGEITDLGTKKINWDGTGTIILEKTIVYDRLVLTGPNGIFDHTWTPCGAIVAEGPFNITNIFALGNNNINTKIYNICGGNIGTITGSIDITGPITLACPSTPKYSGDIVTLKATPRDGVGPYYVEFRKSGISINPSRLGGLSNPIINAPENTLITRTYTLNDLDISSALTGTIDFSVYMADSCPTGAKTCLDTCTITIGCVAPVCNFTVV